MLVSRRALEEDAKCLLCSQHGCSAQTSSSAHHLASVHLVGVDSNGKKKATGVMVQFCSTDQSIFDTSQTPDVIASFV